MQMFFLLRFRCLSVTLVFALWAGLQSVALATGASNSKNLAPGFTNLAARDKVVLLPIDVQLFSLSMGGVEEPKADWTDAARQHMAAALALDTVGLKPQLLSENDADEFAELVSLHAAVASSISLLLGASIQSRSIGLGLCRCHETAARQVRCTVRLVFMGT